MVHPFQFHPTTLHRATLIQPFFMEDTRGFFLKKYEQDLFAEQGIPMGGQEHFVSSSRKGVLRGLHLQTEFPQGKLVSVDLGEIYDVIVDVTPDSPTYLQWEGFTLSAENHTMLYVPPGFAHGFLTLSSQALVSYCCHGKFHPAYDSGYPYNDPTFQIQWPFAQIGGEEALILTEKDRNFPCFQEK